jgi:hypothetical protein
MELGPNMRRLAEMDVADTLKAAVIVGPGDLMMWEVSACLDSDGIKLEVIGRGTDVEVAAAGAMAVLTQHGSELVPQPADDPATPQLEAASLLAREASGVVPAGSLLNEP